MGMGTNILLFIFLSGVIIQTIAASCPSNTTQCAGLSGLKSDFTAFLTGGGGTRESFEIWNLFAYIVVGVGALAIISGTLSFPNPYLLFAVFVAGAVGTYALLPAQMFSSMPSPLKEAIIGGLGFFLTLAFIVWYKGSGEL